MSAHKIRFACVDAPPLDFIRWWFFFRHGSATLSRDTHQEKSKENGKKLYVGNLSYATTQDELQELFSQAGTVASMELIKDRQTPDNRRGLRLSKCPTRVKPRKLQFNVPKQEQRIVVTGGTEKG